MVAAKKQVKRGKAAKSEPKRKATRTQAPAANSAKTAASRPRGRPFPKGVSGNPAGRPKLPEHVREACRALTDDAVATLKEVMRDKKAPAAARVSASNAVLDRAWGKPESDVRVGGLPGAPPIATARIDVEKITPAEAYQYCLNGAELPPGAWAKPDAGGEQ
jgi:hypothetical protein